MKHNHYSEPAVLMRQELAPVFRFDMAPPIATAMTTPIASQGPPEPKATSIAIPIPAPRAIPNPICIDCLFILLAPQAAQGGRECPTCPDCAYCLFPLTGGNASGLE